MAGKLKGVMAVAIAIGLFAGAFPNRTNKGDRLLLKRTSTVSLPAMAVKARPPVGCDPAFSRVADPARAHIFGRCIS